MKPDLLVEAPWLSHDFVFWPKRKQIKVLVLLGVLGQDPINGADGLLPKW